MIAPPLRHHTVKLDFAVAGSNPALVKVFPDSDIQAAGSRYVVVVAAVAYGSHKKNPGDSPSAQEPLMDETVVQLAVFWSTDLLDPADRLENGKRHDQPLSKLLCP